MGMEFTQHVTHGAGGFLVLGGGFQAQFGHGVHDAALHRFQAVADVRQRAVEDDVHGIIQVGTLGIFFQRKTFDAFEIEGLGHDGSVAGMG